MSRRRYRFVWILGALAIVLGAAAVWTAAEQPPPIARARPAEAPRRGRARRPKPDPGPRPPPGADGVAPRPPSPPPPASPEIAPEAAVFGRVRGAERLPDGSVFLEGCGVDPGEARAIDQDGGFFFPAEQGRCRVRAWRSHGALRLPGAWVDVDLTAGGEVDVELEVPTFAPAGMGVGFRPTPDGVVIEQVHPGTPAYEAGLLPGDLITAINGEPTDGMGIEDFLYEGIGPAGSTVRLEGTSADGEPFDTAFARREIVLQ